jgi:hypothetical protein
MTQGLCDTVILPAMGDQILKKCRTSTASWYPETGHAPFLEDPMRFNRELAEFVGKATRALRRKEAPSHDGYGTFSQFTDLLVSKEP